MHEKNSNLSDKKNWTLQYGKQIVIIIIIIK